MRTTIDIPDDLFRRIKVKAAEDGARLKDVVTGLLEQGLAVDATPLNGRRPRRSPPPVFRQATGHTIPSLTNAEIDEILDEEDLQRYFEKLG